jgi:glycosyltransferase involved in cell wall biosynthesis
MRAAARHGVRVVVVDNASSDGSLEKIEQWARGELPAGSANPALSYLTSPPIPKPIQYLALTREQAESSTGEWLSLLDADDYVYPHRFDSARAILSEQSDVDDLDGFADTDGIVCVPSVAGEAPAAYRVQQLLAAVYGDLWSPSMVTKLLAAAGSKKKNLADWLRDDFFKQHCAVFQNPEMEYT